jgi:hypothetical protein
MWQEFAIGENLRAIISRGHSRRSSSPQIKLEVDRRRRINAKSPVLFRMTGSNQIIFDRRIKESLAGRANYFRLHPLSVREVSRMQAGVDQIDFIFRGGWPELHVNRQLNVIAFLKGQVLLASCAHFRTISISVW